MLAKDYKMKELWHPEMSAAGSKAALLAHKDGAKLDFWQPSASADGHSAAVLAMRNKGLSPEIDYGYTPDGRSRALLAATTSVSQGRNRAGSTPAHAPQTYPDSHKAGPNALVAASVSHRASTKSAPDGWNSEANQQARITHIGNHMAPEMFGSAPPVEIELEEKRHQAALRASTVSMAKQMYEYQNRTVLGSDGSGGAASAHARAPSSSGPLDVKQEALRYIHLQDAAHKLAQERLAKVDKELDNQRYREYYGYGNEQNQKKSSRLSMRARNRNRASSDGDADDSDDEAQARRIRSQMSQLNSGVSSVDDKKRQDDRARLMAAAEKRVHTQMHTMDEKVFADTGKVPPAMMEEWAQKARKRAQDDKDLQAQHPGMTHIGGGKFIEQSEIEAIAQARLKPTLDQITEDAEKKRARDEELRLEKEENEKSKREEKQKHREEKEESKRVKRELCFEPRLLCMVLTSRQTKRKLSRRKKKMRLKRASPKTSVRAARSSVTK